MNKEKNTKNKRTSEIQELETKLVEMENNWRRALADYNNQHKRFNEEKEEIRKRSNEVLVLNLLPVLDNMEMLVKHNDDAGFKMILKELLRTLKEVGLEEIAADGKDFDIKLMEAVGTAHGEGNRVLKTENKGYFLNGKLIRPAKVIVGKNNKEES